MAIHVRLFSTMRKVVGQAELEWAEPVEDVRQLWQALSERYPSLKPLGASRGVAVNRRHAPWDHPLRAGDEVAFFPPVSGG